jgi:hypothetical protein
LTGNIDRNDITHTQASENIGLEPMQCSFLMAKNTSLQNMPRVLDCRREAP